MRQPIGSSLLIYPNWNWSLMVCAYLGHVATIMDGSSSLVQAAAKGELKTLTTLLKSGRDVNGLDDEGRSPLFWCAARGDTTGCDLLLKWNANVSGMTSWGATPLHAAAEGLTPDCIEALIKNGADVNGQTFSGDTPLHNACYYGRVQTARVLLKHGASVSIRNDQGRSPIDEARSRGNSEMIDLLAEFSRESSIEKWRQIGYTIVPRNRPKVDNLSATAVMSGQFELITDKEIQNIRDKQKTRVRSRDMRVPCESLEPSCEEGIPIPVAVKNMSVDSKMLKKGAAHRAIGASVFRLDQSDIRSRSPGSASGADDSLTSNCPHCGKSIRSNTLHAHANEVNFQRDDVVTRLRNDYAMLSRMFYDLQVDLVKEREENFRLKTAMKNHNSCFHQGQSPDLML